MSSDDDVERYPLFVTDAELIRRLGVGEKIGRTAIRELERNRGFPKKDALFADKRYWPAVKAFFDDRHKLLRTIAPLPPDGNERRSNGDGTVRVRTPDGREWMEQAKPTDPRSWQKKR